MPGRRKPGARPRHDIDQAGHPRVQQALRDTLTDEHGCWIPANHAGAESEPALNHWRDGILEIAIIDRTVFADNGVRWIVDDKTFSHVSGDVEAILQQEKARYTSHMSRYREANQALEPGRAFRMALHLPPFVLRVRA